MPSPVVAIVGATATGKSALALELAKRHGRCEIVNADSMQLYRGMDIGTAKIPLAQRGGIAHHQLDVLEPAQEASVAVYQERARADIAAIQARGGTPLVVGGSGLYLRALLDDLRFPGTDHALRAALEERLAQEGAAGLYAELVRKDPAAAAVIEPSNTRRVIRALEVGELTGLPFAASLPKHSYVQPAVQLAIAVPGEELERRIGQRVEEMVASGLVEEVAGLGSLGVTAARATGYAQALAHLAGELSLAEMTQAITLATRQLARRQLKWFRRDPRIVWLAGSPAEVAESAAVHLTEVCSRPWTP